MATEKGNTSFDCQQCSTGDGMYLIRDAGQGTPPPGWWGRPHYLHSAMISGLLLVLSSSSAFAENISSILTVDQREAVYSWSAINVCGPYACSGTLQETCNCTAAESTGCGADPTVTLTCAAINELTAGMYFVNNRGESDWSYATRHCDQDYPFNPTTLKCEKQTYTCPSTGGWTLSADQQNCTRPDCPAGYTRDPSTGACQEPCPADQVRNLSTMQCEMVCDAPLIRTDANVCDCPDPLTLIDGNTCIGRDDKELGGNCSQGPSSRLPDWLD